MRRIRVAIADDEPLARRLIAKLLEQVTDMEVVAEWSDGAEALSAIRATAPDLLFLDVEMPVMSGVELMRAIEPAAAPYTVFVTAYRDYAVSAFEVHALDYLLKPIDKQRFAECLERARKALADRDLNDLARRLLDAARVLEQEQLTQEPRADRHVRVRSGANLIDLRCAEIIWIEAVNQYASLHTAQASYLLSESLGRLQRRLDDGHFLRIHRSALINLAHLVAVRSGANGTYQLTMTGNVHLTLARSRRAILPQLLQRVR
jgi:two-component system, LytTR family, response regulator